MIVVLKLDLLPYMDIGAKADWQCKLASIWSVGRMESSVYATTMDGNYRVMRKPRYMTEISSCAG